MTKEYKWIYKGYTLFCDAITADNGRYASILWIQDELFKVPLANTIQETQMECFDSADEAVMCAYAYGKQHIDEHPERYPDISDVK